MLKSFASDNYAGIHPKILKAIQEANQGLSKAYGEDTYTQEAVQLFKQRLGENIQVYFVCNGTAANVLGLSALLKPFQGVICAESAHIHVDECGAPEKYTGCKLLTVPTPNGKITVQTIRKYLAQLQDQHRVQPKVISVTQSTEYGCVYTVQELKAIAEFAHAHGLFVHMDGARISNAAASLNVSLAAITKDAGVDVLSFGGTKNGMMLGEAVIFFNEELGKDFKYIRKQGMQLVSKMRFLSAQFIALLKEDLWLHNAKHANAMAQRLASQIEGIPGIKISREVESNAVFAYVKPELIPLLQKKYHFYMWDEETSEVRWMTAWDTTAEVIQEFVECIRDVVHG